MVPSASLWTQLVEAHDSNFRRWTPNSGEPENAEDPNEFITCSILLPPRRRRDHSPLHHRGRKKPSTSTTGRAAIVDLNPGHVFAFLLSPNTEIQRWPLLPRALNAVPFVSPLTATQSLWPPLSNPDKLQAVRAPSSLARSSCSDPRGRADPTTFSIPPSSWS